ncbi:YbaK/EbsC family protein [Enterovibrio makurazakiensis]|uniref:YbaK/EbsC family protein n=1 Tax=Enterovibrio gelatinilyticus TaxID=2899819 RepID=A0ABT5QV59_9GAMM|nr:YbaK/EbsC family protein [Enterovibrio sp. ZSDZ42]MDD1791899.1 YbaK/EbsC family protein [Enterovibrio sp. ZSDZ42]
MMLDLNTPIIAVLRDSNISHRILPHDRAATTILDAAEQRGVDPRQLVKSMLLKDMGGQYALACLPGTASVDPKKVRALLGCRRMTCVDSAHVQSITGYSPGMITPIAVLGAMPIVFDPALSDFEHINISSGTPLAGVELAYEDLVALCQPVIADISRDAQPNAE